MKKVNLKTKNMDNRKIEEGMRVSSERILELRIGSWVEKNKIEIQMEFGDKKVSLFFDEVNKE